MDYRINTLRQRGVRATKAVLQQNGATLDLVVYPGEEIPEDMIELADNITLVDADGQPLAKIKALDGVLFDNRPKG